MSDSSGKAMVKVKLEKEEAGLLVTCGIQKRKRLPRVRPFGDQTENSLVVHENKQPRIATRRFTERIKFEEQTLADMMKEKGVSFGDKSRKFADQRESSLVVHKNKQSRMINRWNSERIKFGEETLAEILKEKGASIETPISRRELRNTARKTIGDTGLLDHLLKHSDGNVTPGGTDRFRRCHNTEGTMQYWLESADLIKIKLESGIRDPNWIPPAWWKIKSESHEPFVVSSKFEEEIEKMKSDIKELVSDLVKIKRESGIPDPNWSPPSRLKIESASYESSAVSSKLREEIDTMKSEIKNLVSKQKLPNHADATEKLLKEFMSWRVKTDKQIAEISNSLSSTQCMVKELILWKDKVDKQLVAISNMQNNLQANGSTSFSSAPESWEHILQTANLDDFTGNGFEPWDVDADLIDVLPDAVRPDTYSLPPNACKSSFQDQMWFEEQSLLNSEMQRTESCMTRAESRSSNQDKAEVTPGSSMTAGPRSDIDDPNILSQEALKELMTWKAKAEQQLTEMSDAVRALQG
ncbi:uncharacterized protein LOC18013420 [Eutrema salsugineum]|uniref:uncharacterized protein LOC18013420 n=1 Tax=Eutrema salsugineum TaxID=72664 RepID=UPI000CED4FF1|nr:uncharacterized protein LOC18013420 [Eutrema salsugineum]